MQQKNKAQTTTEYIVLITMLGLALALGWNFISEGVMGGVKNLTRSEEIATREVIRQSNTTGGQIPFCNCGPVQTGPGCGVELAGASINCNDRQKYYRKNCTGPGCTSPIEEWCQYDENCCQVLGPEPPGGVAHCWPNYCSSYGQGQVRKVCGALTNPIQILCQHDPVCDFQCGYNTLTSTQTSIQTPGSQACPGDNFQVPGNNLPWTLVANAGACTAANQCESHCPANSLFAPTPPPARCLACSVVQMRTTFTINSVNGRRYIEATVPANSTYWTVDLNPNELPSSIAFNRSYIRRIDFRLRQICHGGSCPTAFTCDDQRVAQSSSENPYEICHVNFRTSTGVGTLTIPAAVSAYESQIIQPPLIPNSNDCDPWQHLWLSPQNTILAINNHSESFVALAQYSGNTLTGVRVMSCSPDNDGHAGFDSATFELFIYLNSC